MNGKWAIVFFLHSLLWSGFSIILHFSTEDHFIVKMLMSTIFVFISYQVSKWWTRNMKKAITFTGIYIISYFSAQQLFQLII
ncbi:hypothetical protein [Bacillus sp. FJAT-47783]|uniref:hypothetical protein n=1 Tax=Bacillus sp. FJAT-47783 TaxID=2922712 RepID=UPI001FACC402|nr:hypothetical protein [Bacillus sp. FJAT-47783]